ncbi:MAG: LolA family protein [Planctomycetota bacterium]
MMRTLCLLLLPLSLSAQQGETPPAPAPDVPAKESAGERAERLLRAHGKRSADVRVLVADYVQRRTTALSKKPLRSSGAFLFVRDPGCVMFRAKKPRPSVVQLTAKHYQVYRPRRKRVERFLLGGPELANGLFAAIGGDVDRLLRDFRIVACDDVAERSLARVRLQPRDEQVRRRVAELQVTLHAETGALRSVAYRDRGGDLVEIELLKLRPNPKDPPSAELEVPDGTKVVEHAPPKPARPSDDGK